MPRPKAVDEPTETTAARIIVRIELTPAAKTAYDNVADRFGMTHISTTSRLMAWFAAQPEGLQAAILGQYPKEFEAEIARLLLNRMSPVESHD